MKRFCALTLLAVALAAGAQTRDRTLSVAPKQEVAGEARNALVIGNSAYANGPLRNPVNDARAMAKALGEAGFHVQLVEDASQAAMQRAVRTFGNRIAKGGIGLFYYAGHGLQVRGRNYLVPVNADIAHEDEIEFNALDVGQVLAKMDTAKNPLNIVILDACRNNPFQRGFRSAQAGLAQMDAPAGTFIAFATAPGSVAADGAGENGVYTKHLLAEMVRPGVPIELMFRQVRTGVMSETKGRQTPWESSSLRGEFAFRPGVHPSVADAVAEAVRREREAHQREMQGLIEAALERQRKLFEAQGIAVSAPAVVASAAPPTEAAPRRRLPVPGDNWTYTLIDKPRDRDAVESSYFVVVTATSDANILDQVSRDGRAPTEWAHEKGNYLVAQVVSVFSPYLTAFEDLTPGTPIHAVAEHDSLCFGVYRCTSHGKVVGRENLRLAGASFDTMKVEISQVWRGNQGGTREFGERILTVWYSQQAKRAIKVASRVVQGTSRSPFHGDFDLELASYKLN
jgi:uncharacterized caspase-like protein